MYKGDGVVLDGTEHLLEETLDEAERPLTDRFFVSKRVFPMGTQVFLKEKSHCLLQYLLY